jgi:hypothetical protein
MGIVSRVPYTCFILSICTEEHLGGAKGCERELYGALGNLFHQQLCTRGMLVSNWDNKLDIALLGVYVIALSVLVMQWGSRC